MGIEGLWKELGATFVEDVLGFLKTKWIGIDVPMALTVRWMRGENDVESLVQGFVQQYREWMSSQNAPGAVIYVFDGTHGNPLKHAEHLRRNAARRQAQENITAQRDLLKAAQSGITAPAELAPASTIIGTLIKTTNSAAAKLRDAHTCLVFDEETKEARVVLNVASLEADLASRKTHQRFVADEAAAVAAEAEASNTLPVVKSTPPAEVYRALMDAFKEEGIPFAVSPDEAEHLLAAMNSRGEIDVMLTGDSDAIPFGGKVILRNFSPENHGKNPNEVVIADEFFTKHNLTRAQVVDACIMAGSDFTVQRGLPGVGFVTAMKHMKKYGTIENFLASPPGLACKFSLQNKHKTTVAESFDYQAARDIFLNDSIVPAMQNDAFSDLYSVRAALEKHEKKKEDQEEHVAKRICK
jgi:5'-3' exonuclease